MEPFNKPINNTAVNEDLIVNILGSLTFVRNWHGFGMGLLRSNFDNTTEPIDRLIRFLQAHGIDTSRTDRKSLAKWTTGGRPLYLRVGREVVRAPTFANAELDKNKLPQLSYQRRHCYWCFNTNDEHL